MKKYKIGIIGVGMVGGALQRYFAKKSNYQIYLYDKFKGIGSIEDINKADVVYICVPTPSKQNGTCDISVVDEAIGYLKGSKVVVIKSTIVPGTTERLQDKYQRHKILFNPEFLTELTADQDTEYPDRQIMGYTNKSFSGCKEIFLQLPLSPFEKIYPATETEMIKYATNTWFALKVAFANQIYDLCEKLKIDYNIVLEGISADKRIGRTHLKIRHKGYRGYGGKCIPKDIKALLALAEELMVEMPSLKATDDYNDKLLKNQGLDPLNTDISPQVKLDNDKSYVNSEEIRVKDK